MRAEGVRLAMIAPAPVDGKPLSHADFDPVWAACSDEGVAPVFHVSEFESPLHPAWREGEHEDGEQLFDSIFLYLAPAVALANLILNGVLERFPRLRVGVVELTASWVPQLPAPHRRRVGLLHAAPRRALPPAGGAAVGVLPAPGAGGRAALRDAEPPRAQGRRRHLHDRQRLAARRGRGRPDGARRERAVAGLAEPARANMLGSQRRVAPRACDRRPRSGRGRSGSGCGRRTCGSRRTGRPRPHAASTTSRSCAPTSSGPSASTRSCSGSRWSSCSRIATTRGRRTCSSTSVTTTRSPSSTSPSSGSVPTPRCWAGSTIWPSRSTGRSGTRRGPDWRRPASPTQIESEISLYFSDPDGVRLELIAEDLGSLYGTPLH